MYMRILNDESRGFSIDQLKGKQLLLMFRSDALVISLATGLLNSGNFNAQKILENNNP